MSIEAQLSELKAAITENTAVLRELIAAGGVTPNNVVSITEVAKPAAAAPKGKAKAAVAPEVEKPTKVAASAPKETEFSDPLDKDIEVVVQASAPEIDVEAVIADCVESFKAKMVAANDDPARKAALKDQFPVLRAKWGLVADAKLITLAPTPEKLVGLLADIKAL